MTLRIRAQLDYAFEQPTDILLHIEAALIPEQTVESANIEISPTEHFARVPAQDMIGERIWLRVQGQLLVDYQATVTIERLLGDCANLDVIPPHQLPGETVQYLMASRYCPSDQFQPFVDAEFGDLTGGAKVVAMRDWIAGHIAYVSGSSNCGTTALETFVKRQGICRDYAHVMITLARAAGIPARIASVYALGVDPPDFHAVAEIFLGGAWHLVDATGMARERDMAKIGVGRDAADIAFMTAFGRTMLNSQSVSVERV
ncbi:transglutaminase [Sphingomonas sp. DBB INV C78]|uniref:transglutaminase-like domain-containing protein n=1 Tax=Sphingomonas sp. DBB INV C78 TaxID=3349434 RepID=UPI0036D42979